MPTKTYRKDIHYGDVVIGSYSGGQFGFAPIVIRENLVVTRVDIKCDLFEWEGSEDGRSAFSYGAYLNRLVRNYLLSKGRHVQTNKSGAISKNPLEPVTYTLGARGSEWQLRIYTRSNDTGQLVRIEWQLRKDLARQVWDIIKPNVYDQRLLMGAFQAVESEILEFGLLQIPYERGSFTISREKANEQSDREKWIRTQVLSACIAEMKESGKNLPELLLADFNRHYKALMSENIEYDTITRQIKAERLFNE
jgi:hypothetical protein